MGDIMNFLKYGALTLLGITYFVILILSIKSRKPVKFLFLNAVFGIVFLLLIHYTKRYTGAFLPINEYTVIGGETLGVPAIIGFLVLKFLM